MFKQQNDQIINEIKQVLSEINESEVQQFVDCQFRAILILPISKWPQGTPLAYYKREKPSSVFSNLQFHQEFPLMHLTLDLVLLNFSIQQLMDSAQLFSCSNSNLKPAVCPD